MDKPLKILVDNSVLSHAVLTKWYRDHSTAPNSIAVLKSNARASENIAREIECIPTLIRLSQENKVELYVYQGVRIEAWRGKYAFPGNQFGDFFAGVRFSEIRFPVEFPKGFEFSLDTKNSSGLKELFRYFLGSKEKKFDVLRLIGKYIQPKHFEDALHLWICVENSMDYFLTMDFKFINFISRSRLEFKQIPIRPSEFLLKLGVEEIDPMPIEYDSEYNIFGQRI